MCYGEASEMAQGLAMSFVAIKGRPARRLAALSLRRVLLVTLVLCSSGVGSSASGGVIRVCADPDNMPFSNGKGEGFENKLAELIASKLDDSVQYTWFSEASGYVPNAVGNDACDLIMGYAQGTGLIDDSNPYYRTSYVLIYRQNDPGLAGVDRLSDPRLKGKRIGLFARTPPASLLALYGLAANAEQFEVNAGESASKSAAAMIDKIASGKLDAGILWGPVGGYYAQRSTMPLTTVPLVKETAGPSTVYGITLGLRPNDPQWKHQINKVIAENEHEIDAILQSYNVPVLDESGNLIPPSAAER
jgi:mxaJ protein